ncbi:MAG: hypothetical protein KF799_09065 [Bdellovibrionales bacterium]|nr:hypothetical protein [Bdellovibrionales bacterium]
MRSKTKLLFLLFFSTPSAWAAACCGGGISAPALIAGQEKAQFTATLTSGSIHADVGRDGLWRARQDSETLNEMRLEAAHLLSDRWQAGIALPLVRREREGQAAQGLGDISLNGAYEYLTDWDYHPWRPKGLGYFHVTVPSGRAVQESDDLYQLSARGRGFWAIGAGTLLTKMFGHWDTFAHFEAHRSLARDYSNALSRGRIRPGLGALYSAGLGYNWGEWRAGGALLSTYEDPIAVEGEIRSNGSVQRYATGTLSLARTFGDWTATLTYSDQTWFGSPANTSLSRSWTVQVMHRWLR